MSEAVAAQAIETAAPAAPPPEAAQADAIAALLDPLLAKKSAPVADKAPAAGEKSAEKAAEKDRNSKEPDHLAAANGRKPPKEPIDPLDPADFDDAKLGTPEAIKAARERIQKAQRQALELTRAAHRAHAAAERREKQLKSGEQQVSDREARAAAWERAVSTAIDDLESGDGERFLTAVGKLSKSGDPVGFWRNASLSLAKGEKLKPQQAAQAAADPELKARLERLEQVLHAGQAQTEEQQLEALKDRNLEAARQHAATPRVVAYATDPRTAAATREALANKMLLAYRQDGRPIDIAEACRRLESDLEVHFELSQRADGTAQAQTNREKETASSGLDAGRETSKDLPKPETSQATIPAALSSAPASAHRPMNEDELKQQQIRQLDAVGFFD